MLCQSNVSDFSTGHTKQRQIELSDITTLNLLGKGGQGCVHKAIHTKTKQVLALKSISLQNADSHRKTVLAEVLVTQLCDHPNIIKSYGAWATDSGVAIALEYMNAGSLKSIT